MMVISSRKWGLGYLYLQNQQADKAVAHLDASLELMPSLQAAFLLAESHELLDNVDKARELYQAVAKADPGSKLGQVASARWRKLNP